jgi:hypothetical protein
MARPDSFILQHTRGITIVRSYLVLCALALIVFGVVSCPALYPVPSSDAGLYLYFGHLVLEGKVPYLDFWIDKGPVTFFLNALGLFVGGGTMWGVWALEIVLLWIAVCAGYRVMLEAFGKVPALVGSVVWICSLPVVSGKGYYVQLYGMPMEWIGLLLFWLTIKKGHAFWRSFALGVLAALAFLTLPNLIGLYAAVVVYCAAFVVLRRNTLEHLAILAAMALGVVSVAVVCTAYFAAHGALAAYWDCTFVYGSLALSSSRETVSPVLALGHAFKLIPQMALILVFWMGAAKLVLTGGEVLKREDSRLVVMALVWLPIEVALATMSGRHQQYYLVMWLPVMGLFSAYGLSRILAWRSERASSGKPAPYGRPIRILFVVVVSAVALAAVLLNTPRLLKALKRIESDHIEQETALYIRRTTSKSDRILLWGGAPAIYFLSERDSPTKFAFQTALVTRGYQKPEMVDVILADLRKHKTVFVIDEPHNLLVPDIECRGTTWPCFAIFRPMPEIARIPEYVRQRYCLVQTYSQDDREFRIYALRSFARLKHLGPYAVPKTPG